MRLLYDFFFIIFSILYLPYLFLKGKLNKGFVQKFGYLPASIVTLKRPVWIHAVSVGEAQLAVRLAKAIKEKCDDVSIITSTTTQTGKSIVDGTGDGIIDASFYYPLDLSFIVSRVVRIINPSIYIMMETELWPNLLAELSKRGVPVLLTNGRISDTSFKNYSMIRIIMKRIFKCISFFCMQSELDSDRIKSLGAEPGKVSITGNMKFSMDEKGFQNRKFEKGFFGFGEEDSIIVAGSTHAPEEKLIIEAYKGLKGINNNLKLVLAPRHVERMGEVKKLLEKSNLQYLRFSDVLNTNDGRLSTIDKQADVLLIDEIGHLKDIYSIATIVFIGGSISKRGGQNPIEAAGWGKPVIFGYNMSNFREISQIFLENNCAVQIKEKSELSSTLKTLLNDSNKREEMSRNAGRVIEENSGALDKTVEIILGYILEYTN